MFINNAPTINAKQLSSWVGTRDEDGRGDNTPKVPYSVRVMYGYFYCSALAVHDKHIRTKPAASLDETMSNVGTVVTFYRWLSIGVGRLRDSTVLLQYVCPENQCNKYYTAQRKRTNVADESFFFPFIFRPSAF